jgi:hypothetical protein
MPEYRARARMHLDLTKGGWMWVYELFDGKKLIGTKTVGRETRNSETTTTYVLLGRPAGRVIEAIEDQEFATAAEFKAAYEARL